MSFKMQCQELRSASAQTMTKKTSDCMKIHVTFSSRNEVKRESYGEISRSENLSSGLQEILQDSKRKVVQFSVAEPTDVFGE